MSATASVPASPASRSARVFIGGLKPHPAKPYTASAAATSHTGADPPPASPIAASPRVAATSNPKVASSAASAPHRSVNRPPTNVPTAPAAPTTPMKPARIHPLCPLRSWLIGPM
ncbi:hypothetical protein GCM10023405_00450 [Streptomonospora salina]